MAKKKVKVGRPPSHPEGKTMLIAARVPEVLVAKLDIWAEKNDTNQSVAITEAIRRLTRKIAVPKK